MTSLQLAHFRFGLLLVLSAAFVAGFLHFALKHPLLLFLVAALWLARQAQRYVARRKLQALLDSGDVARLLQVWDVSPVIGPRGRAAERLLRATALASYGWTTRARQLLNIVDPTNGLSDTMEHRVFLELLLAALEGEHERSLKLADALEALPLPQRRTFRSRAVTQRAGASALARAFAKQGTAADAARLRKASRQNPLLVWPMRYAEALLSLQLGDVKLAQTLLEKAPTWPKQSVYRDLTQALRDRLAVHT